MSDFDSIDAEKIAFLDVGNSYVKVGFRKESHWEIHGHLDVKTTIELLTDQSIEYVIACSVRPENSWLEELVSHVSVAVLDATDIPSERHVYKTIETLGMDRFLVCLGAKTISDTSVIVIDAGSACTLDAMDQNGVYVGGVIMPGIQSLLKVFHKSAPGLPDFEFNIPANFPGQSSKESLEWGLSQLFIDGIESNLSRFKGAIGEAQLFITGGDAEIVSESIEHNATLRQDLIFIGMEEFLEL